MLVGDVLDTSRIDRRFGYSFRDVDIGTLVEEAVAAGRRPDEVALVRPCRRSRPCGDADRLRQVSRT
jgi:hypothetical protein